MRLTNKTNHYTYMLSTTSPCGDQLYYIGVRSSECEPVYDTRYMSSSKLISHMRKTGINFSKTIIETYTDRTSAENGEQQLFEFTQCVADNQCINLRSNSIGYSAKKTRDKMLYFKQLFSQINPPIPTLYTPRITDEDKVFMVAVYKHSWAFVNHPEYLRFYYPTTGTKTYWPGREDRLMTKTLIDKKYYSTAVETVDGTAYEQIDQLLTDHYVSGQRTPILETIEPLMKFLAPDEWPIVYSRLKIVQTKDNQWIIARIAKSRPNSPPKL